MSSSKFVVVFLECNFPIVSVRFLYFLCNQTIIFLHHPLLFSGCTYVHVFLFVQGEYDRERCELTFRAPEAFRIFVRQLFAIKFILCFFDSWKRICKKLSYHLNFGFLKKKLKNLLLSWYFFFLYFFFRLWLHIFFLMIIHKFRVVLIFF